MCFTFGILVIFLLSGCAAPSDSTSPSPTKAPEIRIGILLPLTGPDAALGKAFRNAIELALKMESPDISGKSVRVIIEDEGGVYHALALEKVKKLVQSDKVDLILGPYNGESGLAVLPYTSSLPMVNLKWSVPISNKSELGNSYGFWTTPLYQDITYPLGLYVYNQGIDKVTILGTNESLALDFVEGFKSGFKVNNGQVIQEQWTAPEEPSYTPFLKNLFPADALICATLGDAAKVKLFKEYAELGLFQQLPVFIAETGALSPSTLQEMGTTSLA
jgi:branched-chain amino acid transport system substrate-binding protein